MKMGNKQMKHFSVCLLSPFIIILLPVKLIMDQVHRWTYIALLVRKTHVCGPDLEAVA